MNKTITLSLIAFLGIFSAAFAGESPSADGARQYFVNLADGDIISSPFKIIFGLNGMGVAPAGTEKANTGHHHLFIDRPVLGKGEDGADEFDGNIISDEHNVHFGKGQTETMLELTPGTHTLQLVLGDLDHIPHNKPVSSDVITITVK
ncbi:MAG: rod shape-determining protein RodA [Hyphomicrobiales bacterium]|nr:MAG: rod shape-determining protein RodA [Hyphomicrobiales bacterium]